MAVRKPAGFVKTGRKPKSHDVASERARFFRALAKYRGARAKAAKELGYNVHGFSRRAKELGLSPRAMAKEFKQGRQGNLPRTMEERREARAKIVKYTEEQTVRLLASEFRIDKHGMRKLITQSGITPGWAEKQIKYLQQLCEIGSRHYKVNLAWRDYPELVTLFPSDMQRAVPKYALALAAGKKPGPELLREPIAKKPALESASEAAAPERKAQETDLLKERSRLFGALLKHKGAAKHASGELGYGESGFNIRAAQLGVRPKIMKDAFTQYNLRKALIDKGGNVRAAAVAFGTTTAYFGSLMKKFGIDAERYRQAGAEPEKSQLPQAGSSGRLLREPRKIKEMAPLRVENTTIILVAQGFKKGTYDEQHPPSDEALKIIERACNFDAQLIQHSVGVNYSMWHNWLVRRKLIGWVDRESKLEKARQEAQKAMGKRDLSKVRLGED